MLGIEIESNETEKKNDIIFNSKTINRYLMISKYFYINLGHLVIKVTFH